MKITRTVLNARIHSKAEYIQVISNTYRPLRDLENMACYTELLITGYCSMHTLALNYFFCVYGCCIYNKRIAVSLAMFTNKNIWTNAGLS